MSRAKCRLVKIDDEWIRVQGAHKISPEAQAALVELVRAVRNRDASRLPSAEGAPSEENER